MFYGSNDRLRPVENVENSFNQFAGYFQLKIERFVSKSVEKAFFSSFLPQKRFELARITNFLAPSYSAGPITQLLSEEVEFTIARPLGP